jgi:hypothetical protein
MEKITSRQNPLCTHLRKLASSASYRRQRGEFLCDSPKLLREALLWGAEIRTIVATEGVELPEIHIKAAPRDSGLPDDPVDGGLVIRPLRKLPDCRRQQLFLLFRREIQKCTAGQTASPPY